jgi:type IV secretion system protein TrbL
MRRSASSLAAVGLAATVLLWSPAPASAGVLSSAGGILSGVGGTILGVGKSVLCKGASAAGTVAEGASTVGGAAVGGASTEGAGAAEGAAAGSVIGGVIKKGIGGVTNLICSSGSSGGVGGTLVKTAVGGVAAAATFDLAARWLIAAAQKITGAIVSTITSSTSPQLTAAWFQQSFAPMAALGAALALLVTLIALTSAAARRDPAALAGTLAGIVRAGVGTGLLIALTTLALQVSDGISADVIRTSHQTFWSEVGQAWGSSGFGGFGSSALAMLMAILEVVAGVIVWLELAVRNAAIYLAVLFFPVALAASIWPTLAGWTSRLARLLFLFVILKPVVLIVLAFAGNAALAGLSLNGSLPSSAGTVIAAITIFALAAMAPWALMLIVAADAESAAVGAGVRAAAGHAVSDSAASLGRVGGRVRGGASRASGAIGSAGGSIRGTGRNRPGGGPSGLGGPRGGGGGGGTPPGPSGYSPTSPGGDSDPDSNGAGAAPAQRGRTGQPGRASGATAGAAPQGAVALAAGLTSAAGGRGSSPGAGENPTPTVGRNSGGTTRAPSRKPSRPESGGPPSSAGRSRAASPASPGRSPKPSPVRRPAAKRTATPPGSPARRRRPVAGT